MMRRRSDSSVRYPGSIRTPVPSGARVIRPVLSGWSRTTPRVMPCSVGAVSPWLMKGAGAKINSRSGAACSGLERTKATASPTLEVSGPRRVRR